jgi:hypothetical protein
MFGRSNARVSRRTAPVVAGTGSAARSVEAYYPWYPPPAYPQGLEHSTYSGFTNNPPASSSPIDRAPVVKRNDLRVGEINRYTHGNVEMTPFHMRATGQVESSEFQPYENMPNIVMLNTWLYRAAKGYPQNLHLSEKVPTLPQNVLNPSTMQPAPHITRTVFNSRSFSSAPSIPAKPSAT